MFRNADWPGWALAAALLLAGCDKHDPTRQTQAAPPPPAAPAAARFAAAEPADGKAWFTEGVSQGPALHLAYTHSVGLQIGGGAIAAHFAAARDRCLNAPALHCILLHAEFGTQPIYFGPVRIGQPQPPPPHIGSLRVRLPHDQIAGFANSLTDKLPGEPDGLITILRQETSAEDLGRPIADVGQRLAQLQDYLASLKALGERLTIGVGDLVKIAGETARTQTEIEAAQAEQRDLKLRVSTEELDVDFTEPAPPQAATDPIAESLAQSREIFANNVAAAMDFAIAAVPWIPFALIGLLLLWIVKTLLLSRRSQKT
jgi:hypothetical protein